MRFKRRTLLHGAAAVSAAGLVSCGSKPSGPAAPSATGQNEGDFKLAGSQELLVRIYDEPTGFDPAAIFRVEAENVAYNIYSGLTTFDPKTGEPVADLAEHWEVS